MIRDSQEATKKVLNSILHPVSPNAHVICDYSIASKPGNSYWYNMCI